MDANIILTIVSAGVMLSLSSHSLTMPTLFGLARSGGYQIVQMAGLVSSYSDLIMILPYVLTLLLLVFFSKHNHSPRAVGFSESDLAVMQQNAIEASFAPAEWKRKLRKELSFNKSSKVTDGKN